ncbi:MAG: hypothetical protein JNJ49_10800 [Bdellovibrionaceae bacterium]|nr:hypothetical protein [Pseudobdellovibrionaceae bacterium]
MLQNLEQIVKTIWPFMILHAAVSVLIFSAMFYALKRAQIFPSTAGLKPLKAGTVVGLAISLFYSSDLMIKNAQSQAMSQAIAEQQQAANAANQANPLALRADFLKAIDFLTNNPDQLTLQSKAKLYEQFGGLFPNGIADVRAYYDQLKVAFTCQLSMYEDGLQTFRKKKIVRSEQTAKCEGLPGTFFNRERLIGPEMLQAHSLLKERILKPVPGDKALSEADLKLMIEQQQKKMATLERIFQ